MKVWVNAISGRVVGYQSDFPMGTPGLTLMDRPDPIEGEYTVEKVEAVEQVNISPGLLVDTAFAERAALEEAYFAKNGKKPHPAMKLETLKAAVEE